MANPPKDKTDSPGDWFPRTHWSQVLAAGGASEAGARTAFGRLYEAYRGPLLGYLRMVGNSDDAAQDLLQGFFEYLLSRNSLAKVRQTGKFRSWLLASLKHYVRDVWAHNQAQKRGGKVAHVPLESEDPDFGVTPVHAGRTPDQEYDRQFAIRFLDLVQKALAVEYRLAGKADLFAQIQPFLADSRGGPTHAELGQRLGMSESNVSQSIFRLRQRYRELVDQELGKLVGVEGSVEEEKRLLLAALKQA